MSFAAGVGIVQSKALFYNFGTTALPGVMPNALCSSFSTQAGQRVLSCTFVGLFVINDEVVPTVWVDSNVYSNIQIQNSLLTATLVALM